MSDCTKKSISWIMGLCLMCTASCSDDTNADKTTVNDPACNCVTGEHCSASELESCAKHPPTNAPCPEECLDNCDENGQCPTKTECPSECPDTCNQNGQCPSDSECPSECTDECDENGLCPSDSECPSECLNHCDENGQCIIFIDCPDDCPDNCDENGQCLTNIECPAECPETCDENGQCPAKTECPAECPETCDENGQCPAKAECPAECPETCDENGQCPAKTECPAECPETCDENGQCQCPKTCKTHCNDKGVCQCPETCKDSCDANGECLVMCGKEVVQKMYFSHSELDILVPGSTARTSADSTVYIKTDKNTYNLQNAPCKSDIVLTMSDKSIATVTPNSTTPKNATFKAVKAGTTTCTVSLKGQPKLTGSIKIHVLDLDRLHNVLTYKNDSNVYIHLYKKPLKLIATNRVSQGFDFYNDKFIYFTQLPEIELTKTKDGKTSYTHTQLDIFKNDFTKNSASMKFPAAGHGQNLIAEHIGEKDYLWFGSYGTLICKKDDPQKCTDGYKQSQTIARVEWDESKSKQLIYPSDVKEHYYYSDKGGSYYYSFEPAMDAKNNIFAFRAAYNKDGRTYVKTFHLSDVEKLTTTKVTLERPIQWIDKNNELKDEYKPTITVKDISSLKAIHEFDKQKIAVQGMELENGILYTIGDARAQLTTPEGKNKQYEYRSEVSIYIYTYAGKSIAGGTAFKYNKQGNGSEYIYHLTTVTKPLENLKESTVECKVDGKIKQCTGYYMDNAKLDGLLNFTENGIEYKHNGYLEAEGIRVTDGKFYISATVKYKYTVKGKTYTRPRQVILVYNLAH